MLHHERNREMTEPTNTARRPLIEMTETTETVKRPLVGYLTAGGGGVALLLGLVGCLLYLVFWFTLSPVEQLGIVGNVPVPGSAPEKLLVPKLINYLSLLVCFATLGVGVVAMILEEQKLWAAIGMCAAIVAFTLLSILWIWTVSRRTEDYFQKAMDHRHSLSNHPGPVGPPVGRPDPAGKKTGIPEGW
jgi:hypothetical protein